MRLCVFIRGGAIVGVAALATACNAIIGVVDVSPICQVDADIKLVMSGAQASLSTYQDKGATASELVMPLNANANLTLDLYDTTVAVHPLTMTDAQFDTCNVCVYIESNSGTATGMMPQALWALGQGELTLTKADSTGLTGSMQGLKLRQVTTAQVAFTEIDNGCMVAIDDVQFDLPYDAPTTP